MLEAGGRRFSSIITLILDTNDATGHDMNSENIVVRARKPAIGVPLISSTYCFYC